jgi:hypothetical protein
VTTPIFVKRIGQEKYHLLAEVMGDYAYTVHRRSVAVQEFQLRVDAASAGPARMEQRAA